MRNPSLTRVQRDTLHVPPRQDTGDGMAEFVKRDDKHLERPEHPFDVREIPEEGYGDGVGGDDAEGYFLGVVNGEGPAGENSGGGGSREAWCGVSSGGKEGGVWGGWRGRHVGDSFEGFGFGTRMGYIARTWKAGRKRKISTS